MDMDSDWQEVKAGHRDDEVFESRGRCGVAWVGGLPGFDAVVGRMRANEHESRLKIKLKLQLRAELGMARCFQNSWWWWW